MIHQMDGVLSLNLLNHNVRSGGTSNPEDALYVEAMIQKRKEAKKEKNWALADAIRHELKEKGFEIKDTPEGTTWEKCQK